MTAALMLLFLIVVLAGGLGIGYAAILALREITGTRERFIRRELR